MSSYAHRGGVIKSGPLKGCHSHRKQETFHCHSKSTMNGKSFTSKSEALMSATGKTSLIVNSERRIPKYSRSLYGNWRDRDGDCMNTRHEILKDRSLAPTTKKKCRVITGKWADYYFDEYHTKSSAVEIDHLVPLKEAHVSGAHKWSRKKKVAFANDLDNLVITSSVYNSKKGAQTPLTWAPVDKGYACKYISDWLKIKNKYALMVRKELVAQYNIMRCKR